MRTGDDQVTGPRASRAARADAALAPPNADAPPIQIRPAAPADTPAIHALIGGIFAEYGYTLDLEREDPHLQAPGPYFRAAQGEFWVACRESRLAGTVAAARHADVLELKSLYVDPGQRRAGLGRRLCEQVLAFARAAGCGRVELWSDTLFIDAHRLYERLGFMRDGQREQHLTNRFSEYHYTLVL